jgi:two-component system, cell cycle response regulator DivK
MRSRGRILYIEDNSESRMLVRRVLEAEGYTMLEARTSTEALEQLQEEAVDLALMDINMPGMDGYTLAARIKAHPLHSDVPILAITANPMQLDRERSMLAGCDGYIEKPIDIDTLVQQMESLLQRAADGP